jgi:NDP-sugar pyrophosphorylase family protein
MDEMKVSELFSEEMEPALNKWIKRFTSPADLFAAIPQLYAKLQSQCIQGSVEDGVVVDGPVHIGAGSLVQSHATIRGPSIVGDDTFVGSHAEIQPGCFIGSQCVIGHSCLIVESMLMNGVIVRPFAFIRNSVIGFGSFIGAGAVLGTESAELLTGRSGRGVVVGDYASIGANTVIKPGAIIARRTSIGDDRKELTRAIKWPQ